MDDVAAALDRFVTGEDTSLAAANRLELLLDRAYPADELVQEVVVDLASYRPGGGDFLRNEEWMQARLERLRAYLARRGSA